MKIIVATNKGGLDDNISPVFSRCQTFTIVEVEGNEIKSAKAIPNQFASAIHGAGIQAGQWAVSQNAKAVIAGNFGPNVSAILQRASVEVIVAQGKVKDVVEKYLKGELKSDLAYTFPPTQPMRYAPYPVSPPYRGAEPSMQMSKEEEIKMIEEEIRRIEDLLSSIKRRLEELKE